MGKPVKSRKDAHRQIISGVLFDQSITDSVIVQVRSLHPDLRVNEIDDRIENALALTEQTRVKHQDSGDLNAVAHSYFALGVFHLYLDSGDDALEDFQICAEMSEAQKDTVTQAWALAFHGLTKVALYELLKEDGLHDIDEARKLFEVDEHEAGIRVIKELFSRV